ncbi:oxidoreductase [Mangrovibacter sp. MFB070]|uniref:SDR family NAD(P)-dependent oxidoreductase n=1 Tax=Mangrovibacter sp. MFB070 TaxID=1224318 RepID=UPI0004DAA0F5|nr:SDR family oxidoreductase [Mangrovibacter sp. MFB070]KEA49993.1 oxidoreductase [Mangrovibacter sp. MFB070]
MSKLTGKTALVTGGGSGIGREIARRLASEGAEVVIIGRSEAPLIETAIGHDNISHYVADVVDSQSISELMVHIKNKFNKLDIVVNNAGVAPNTPFESLTMDQYDFIFNVNVRGLIDVTRQALPLLKLSKGVVINISSGVAHRPTPYISVYSASKAAVSALTKALAKEFAPFGVRVNAVSAGATETPLYDKTGLQSEEEKQNFMDAVNQSIPLGRFARPEEIAGAVAFLASDDASYATGSDVIMDGGYSA